MDTPDWQTYFDRRALDRFLRLLHSGLSVDFSLALTSFSWEVEQAMDRHPSSGSMEP